MPQTIRSASSTLAILGLLAFAGQATAGDAASRYSRGFLVDISASWCKPCQSMVPAIERLQREGLPIRQFDIDQRPDLKAKYDVRSLPTLLLIVDNQVVKRMEGAVGESQLRELISQIPAPRRQANEPLYVDRDRPSKPKSRRSPLRLASNGAAPRSRPIVRANASEPQVDPAELQTGPMAASVRIRIRDGEVVNYGSGTIVESEIGRSRIVTCGHLFRDVSRDAQVEVDFYRNGVPDTVVGRCLDFDLKSDVGLIEVPTTERWPVVEVASSAEAPQEGDAVLTIGCSGGEDPTEERTKITKLNRYLGPDNIEVAKRPVQGRSGGGLFDRDGRLVGVCNAEVPNSNTGLYAGLAAVHDMLDDTHLAYLYRDPSERPEQYAMADEQPKPLIGSSERADDDYSRLLDEVDSGWPVATGAGRGRAGEASATAGQAIDSDETEIVCIIRSKRDPKGTSRVVIIDSADAELLERIEGPAVR